jgi:hypothetical protein
MSDRRRGALVAVAAFVAVALAGCSGDGPEAVEDDIPLAISRQQVEELEARILEEHPRSYAFPEQQVLAPALRIINDTIDIGEAIGLEPINDDSVADAAGTVKSYDISDLAPANQPVELRIRLKWWGDPGASADLDIFTDVPGLRTSHSTGFDEESWNWNIVTKTMVVNTARLDGEPFEVGVQAQNGKVAHPDGVPFSLTVEAFFAQGVLSPQVPYALTLPAGATLFILESEPVTGDEHVTTELVIIDPNDRLHRVVAHNDIGTETLSIPASRPGEYIFYVASQHGGFLRVEADIPNPDFQARIVAKTVTETVVAGPAIVAPAPPDEVGQTGGLTLEGPHPLDIYAFIRSALPASLSIDVAFAISGSQDPVHALVAGPLVAGDFGRIGLRIEEERDRTQMTDGEYTWALRGNVGIGTEVGYGIVGFTR